MFTGKHPAIPPWGLILDRSQRDVIRLLERMTRLQGGSGTVQWQGATSLAQPPVKVRFAQVDSGGITARSGTALGFGDVTEQTIATSAPTTTAIAATPNVFTAFNLDTTAIAPTTYVTLEELWGLWVVIGTAGAGGFWCHLSGTLAAATGTWPSLTAGSLASQTIYSSSTGSLVALSGTHTVINWYATAFASGKTTALRPAGNGSYEVLEQDC